MSITWREDGQKGMSSAYLGEHRVGAVWDGGTRAVWELWLGSQDDDDPDGEASDVNAAKLALEEAMEGWLAKAGLVSLPEGHVVVPREPTEAMLQGACDGHKPGQPMTEGGTQECPHIEGRRIVWGRMLAAIPASPRSTT
jgi:hypothetical protein